MNRSVAPRRMVYSSTLKDMPNRCKKMRIFGEHHLFLGYDPKRSRDENGEITQSLKPQGSSGGALINPGQIATLETLSRKQLPVPKLSGRLIKNPKFHNVAVKIGFVLGQIDTELV